MPNNERVTYPKAGENYDDTLKRMIEERKNFIYLNGLIVRVLLVDKPQGDREITGYRIVPKSKKNSTDKLRQQAEIWLNRQIKKAA